MIKDTRRLYYAGLILLSLMSLVNLMTRMKGVPAEVSLRLECARLILDGKTPYLDFFVLDSPLALFLSAVPLKFASLLGLDGFNIRITLVFEWIVSVASVGLCSRLILRRKRLRNSLWCHTLLFTMSVLNIGCVYQFGQPEHYLMLGMTPYLVARWLEYSGKKLAPWESILSGAFGGLVTLLDPFFVAVPCAFEFALLSHFMRFSVRLCSPLLFLILTASTTYSIIVFFNQSMMHNYGSYVLPLLMIDRQTFDMRLYGWRSCPDSRVFIYLMLLASLLVLAMRKKNSLITPLVVASWLGFAYFVAECKGYFFQALPMFWTASLVITICGAVLLKDLNRWSRRKKWLGLNPVAVVGGCTAIATCGFVFVEQLGQDAIASARKFYAVTGIRDVPDFVEVVRREQKSHTMAVFNNNVAPCYPAMTLMERRPGSRIMWSFFIPILNRAGQLPRVPRAETERLSKFYYKILKEDLENKPPDLVFFEQGMVWDTLQREGLATIVETQYSQYGEALFYSHNFPPLEYSNPNYRLSVFKKSSSD
ncbi:MAG: hypothetical protein K2X93_23135 [Candidatus Obscuribacterales bacterium]|nr:hypothetical protein [Candidatus Obscuribacterales bacterium]